MVLVVDTSVVLAVAADEATKPALIAATQTADLVAPTALPVEIGNALSAMFKRRRIGLDEAIQILKAFRSIPVRLAEIDVDRSLRLASDLDIYAYDAYVIDCALAHDAPLLTLDRGQRNAASRAGVALHPH